MFESCRPDHVLHIKPLLCKGFLFFREVFGLFPIFGGRAFIRPG
jgi:hypothetical protein